MTLSPLNYRCTLPLLYAPGSLGHHDVTARQGHYVNATESAKAALVAARQSPGAPATLLVDVQHPTTGELRRFFVDTKAQTAQSVESLNLNETRMRSGR